MKVKRLCCVFVVVAVLAGCPKTGAICAEGTVLCGGECLDLSADSKNCGACETVCGGAQNCVSGSCACRDGTRLCGDSCAPLTNDAQNCGACGQVCQPNQVCEEGQCKATCSLTETTLQCGQSCVNPQTDSQHCGACDRVCQGNRECRSGLCTYDAVLACAGTGQVRGLVGRDADAGSAVLGPLASAGSFPAALNSLGNLVLVADGIDRTLKQLDVSLLDSVGDSAALGDTPNQLVTANLSGQTFLLVPNAGAGTLQALKVTATVDHGRFSNGLGLITVAEFSFGSNTYPEAVVVSDGDAFVPLYGGFGEASAPAGQRIARVRMTPLEDGGLDLSDAGQYSLSSLNLNPLEDAGTPIPRPYAIALAGGKVFALLSNLNGDYQPAGPGMLAQLDPQTGALSTINLGVTQCLNPVWLASLSDGLLVSCRGRVTYDDSYNAIAVEGAGVVRLALKDGSAVVTGFFLAACPTHASCSPPVLGRVAVLGSTAYVAEETGGRLLVIRLEDAGGLSLLRGFDQSLEACPQSFGYAGFTDVAILP